MIGGDNCKAQLGCNASGLPSIRLKFAIVRWSITVSYVHCHRTLIDMLM